MTVGQNNVESLLFLLIKIFIEKDEKNENGPNQKLFYYKSNINCHKSVGYSYILSDVYNRCPNQLNIQMVDLKSQYLKIKSQVDLAIEEVINSTQFASSGRVKGFQKELADYIGVNNSNYMWKWN